MKSGKYIAWILTGLLFFVSMPVVAFDTSSTPYIKTVFEDMGTYYQGTADVYGVSSGFLSIAQYKDNQLVQVDIRDYQNVAEQFVVHKGEVNQVKLMLWQDMTAMKPLCKTEIYGFSETSSLPTPEPIEVVVYASYGQYKQEKGKFSLNTGQALADISTTLPSVPKGKLGYTKDSAVASVYTTKTEHRTPATHWYFKNGDIVPFDESVVLMDNTDVYRFFRNFALKADIMTSGGKEGVQISSYYNEQTRLIDVLKNMTTSAEKQLQNAISGNWIPEYEDLNDSKFSDLIEQGVVDESMVVQMVHISDADIQSMDSDTVSVLQETGVYDAFADGTINLVEEILSPLYIYAQETVADKLSAEVDARYEENPYIKYFVEADMIDTLFAGDGAVSGDSSGYIVKPFVGTSNEDSYYDYLIRLMLAGDDAIYWYTNDGSLTQKEYDAVCDALFGKTEYVRETLHNILQTLPKDGEIKQVFEAARKLNQILVEFESQMKGVLYKYYDSNVDNGTFVDGTMANNTRVKHFVDVLLEQEDAGFNVDAIYDLFCRFDDSVQEKLLQLDQMGRLKKSVTQFEESGFGAFFKGDGESGDISEKIAEIEETGKVTTAFHSIYDLLRLISQCGIEPFQIENSNELDISIYRFTIGDNDFTVHSRFYY